MLPVRDSSLPLKHLRLQSNLRFAKHLWHGECPLNQRSSVGPPELKRENGDWISPEELVTKQRVRTVKQFFLGPDIGYPESDDSHDQNRKI